MLRKDWPFFLYCIILCLIIITSCQKYEPNQYHSANLSDKKSSANNIESNEFLEKVLVEGSFSLVPLSSGPFMYVDGGFLGKSKVFWNLMDEVTCYMLSINGQEVDWIYSAYKMPSSPIFFKCIQHGGSDIDPAMPSNAVPGEGDFSFYKLGKEGQLWEMQKIDIPGYMFISGGNICGELLAYWANYDNNWRVSIYDFGDNTIKKDKSIGNFQPATNDPLFFPVPRWKKDCSSVLFPKHYYMEKSVILSLGKEGI